MKKIAVWTLYLLFCVPLAWADVESSDPFEKKEPFTRWYLSVGPYGALLDTDVNVGVQTIGLGIKLDVEKFLGLQSETLTFRIDGSYRAGKTGRHRISASWFAFRREGENTLAEDIPLPPEFGGGIIPIGTTVEGKFNIDIIKTTYRYSVILDDRIDLNVGGGLYIAPITVGYGIKGTDFETTSLTAPLPVVGIGLITALTPKWFAMAQADLMYLQISGYKGGVTNSLVGVEYRPFKKVGFGLRAEGLNLQIENSKESDIPGLGDFIGTIDFSYVGASIYLSVFF